MDKINETNKILEAIDEYIWWMPLEESGKISPARARSGEVIHTLVRLLVDKGILSANDVKSMLGGTNEPTESDKG